MFMFRVDGAFYLQARPEMASPEVTKLIFMLSSTDHVIYQAYKC